MSTPTLTVTKDFTAQFNEAIKRFKSDNVQIGIPRTDDPREDDAPINNATLLALNTFGSPANNIPARPVLEVGIKNAKDAIAEQFKRCAQESFSKGLPAMEIYYERAGIIASNSVKKAINEQDGIDPPADATIKARESRGFNGTKALVVTGQMRNAITFVLKTMGGL
jgi:hypothetical protein